MLWHLGFFSLFVLPASYDLCNIVSPKRYNYCSENFNSYFSIIPTISRSLSHRQKKRFEDVYDLHYKRFVGRGKSAVGCAVYKWLFELPCTHIESTIIQLSCTHSFVPSSTAVAASANDFNEKMCFKVRAFNSTTCAFQMANGTEDQKTQSLRWFFLFLFIGYETLHSIINWIKCPKSIAFHLSLQRDKLKGGSDVSEKRKIAKFRFTPFFMNAYRGREKQCKLLVDFLIERKMILKITTFV